VVQGGVADLAFLGKQVARLAEQRDLGVEHGTDDPVVEIAQVTRCVTPDELPAVGGGAADDRVDEDGKPRIGDSPELRGEPVFKGSDDEVQRCLAARDAP
jgi:hypothetical protein